MARLPIVGGDANSWGVVLNDYLSVSLESDGSLKDAAVQNALPATVNTNARVAVAENGTLVGTRRKLNLVSGTNIDVVGVDDAAGEKVDLTIGITGSVAVTNGGTGATDAATARTNLSVPQSAGFTKISVGTVAPSSPIVGDLWVDTN